MSRLKREWNYVAHDCRNTRGKSKTCNNRFIFKDITKANTLIPTWAYCEECCKKLGINFDKQRPSHYRSREENEALRQKGIKLLESKNKNG